MSRGALADAQDEAPRLHTGGLAPWQAHKVAEFIDASLDAKIRGNWSGRSRANKRLTGHGVVSTLNTPVTPTESRVSDVSRAAWPMQPAIGRPL